MYYQNRGDLDVSNGGPGLKAFPAGFKVGGIDLNLNHNWLHVEVSYMISKMISGNPARRGTQYVFAVDLGWS